MNVCTELYVGNDACGERQVASGSTFLRSLLELRIQHLSPALTRRADNSPWNGSTLTGEQAIMGSDGDADGPRKRRRLSPPETGPYVLRELVDKVPVSAEGDDETGHITCVEYWSTYRSWIRLDPVC